MARVTETENQITKWNLKLKYLLFSRTSLTVPSLVLCWLVSLGLSLLDQPQSVRGEAGPQPLQPLQPSRHTLVCLYLPAALITLPCQIYLYLVASRHYRWYGQCSVFSSGRVSLNRRPPPPSIIIISCNLLYCTSVYNIYPISLYYLYHLDIPDHNN